MRLVIDLQAAQGKSSRFRGIGRYVLSLTQWLIRTRGEHEIFVAMSGQFAESNEPLRAALADILPPDRIVVWHAPGPSFSADPANAERRKAAELIRESALASLNPDFVLLGSLFEGWDENMVTSIGRLSSTVPTAVVLFDLIPLIHRDVYLKDVGVTGWYETKLAHLRNADLLLSISESSRQEAIDHLAFDPAKAINISTAAEDHFAPATVDARTVMHLKRSYGLDRPFVMYTGGIDFRKNIEGLIKAYSEVSELVRRKHQLAIVCSVHDVERRRLLDYARSLGLEDRELIMTGFISEADLIACYRLCKLFVFPSWHEGFGLPVLEAMMCGRPVIASDRSSLPEVVGLESALFDPFDIPALAAKIETLLSDNRERKKLERHSLLQAARFSWESTARKAWDALESAHARTIAQRALPAAPPTRKPRLAYLSPLPPQPSGIADYSAELLPELARHYEIDLIVSQPHITDVALTALFPVRSADWFAQHSYLFDRVVYQFGNSEFHKHMFDLLRGCPGVVVLHDFYMSGISCYREATGERPHGFPRDLLASHGWNAARARFETENIDSVVWDYPANLPVIQDATGIIVHSQYAQQLARTWFGPGGADGWREIPLPRKPFTGKSRDAARKALGLGDDEFCVCSFGMLGRQKLNQRLLDAWMASSLASDPSCHLIFVGQNEGGAFGAEMQRRIRAEGQGRVTITGWADPAAFRRWLDAADVGVQLRTLSRGETSAAVLDCMNAGLATIANANGSMAELPTDAVWLLDDDFDDVDLVDALETLRRDRKRRTDMGDAARRRILENHSLRRCADDYAAAIEEFYANAIGGEVDLERALSSSELALQPHEWSLVGETIARNLPPQPRPKRLLVDVSVLAQADSRAGIQRVVRAILRQWLAKPPAGWVVEPVYATAGASGFRYARRFTCRFLDIPEDWCDDDRVDPVAGDRFIGLDLSLSATVQQTAVLHEWRRSGIAVNFVVYDLLPLLLGDYFDPLDRANFRDWLATVAQFDGLICISRAVADDCRDWLDYHVTERELPLALDWLHLGVDTQTSVPTTGRPDDAEALLEKLRKRHSFLLVGTIEPRRAVAQVLDAFEKLWAGGTEVNLVLVGKLGWMMDKLSDRLTGHPERDRQLFWLEAASDDFLDAIYGSSNYLIAASEGEGFGLPIVEAARHDLPVIARDIPVFREVAGDAAIYFPDVPQPQAIADAVSRALKNGKRRQEATMAPWQTWDESAASLMNIALGKTKPYCVWLPDGTKRFHGNDARLVSAVGKPERSHVKSNGKHGLLIEGTAIRYIGSFQRLRITGQADKLVGNEWIEIREKGGAEPVWRERLAPKPFGIIIDQFIELPHAKGEFELRLWVDAQTRLTIETIAIEPVKG